MRTTEAVRAVGVSRRYRAGISVVTALDNVSVALERGRFTSVVGRSGSGKSTLLHCLAGLDTVDSGAGYLGHLEEITGHVDPVRVVGGVTRGGRYATGRSSTTSGLASDGEAWFASASLRDYSQHPERSDPRLPQLTAWVGRI